MSRFGCRDPVYAVCYLSPNIPLEEYIDRLEAITRFGGDQGDVPIIIAGDFNARSVVWGDVVNNRREELVYEMAAVLDLRLLNVGAEPTCYRLQGRSVIDLTWASPSMLARVNDWRISQYDTFSDHVYIHFEVRDRVPREPGMVGPIGLGWSSKNFSRDQFAASLETACWADAGLAHRSPTEAARWIVATMMRACDEAATKVRATNRRAVYWWTPRIDELRRSCLRVRRRYTRAGRRGGGANETRRTRSCRRSENYSAEKFGEKRRKPGRS